MALTFEQLQKIWALHKGLDDVLENLQFHHKDMKSALSDVYVFLEKQIKIAAFYVETENENLVNTVFTFGACSDDLKLRVPLLNKVNEVVCFMTHDGCWFAQPIDVDSNIIGTIAIGFRTTDITSKEFCAEVLNCISELLDTYFYSIHCCSVKQSMIMGLQEALECPDIAIAMDKAILILANILKFKHILVIYTDRDNRTASAIKYLYYDSFNRINDSFENHSSKLDRIIRENSQITSIPKEELRNLMEFKEIAVSYLTHGMFDSTGIGLIAIEPDEASGISVLAQELLQIFTEEFRQRLVDLNREKNMLRKYFPNTTVTRLLSEGNYVDKYLKAREAEIGIIFADISGFTKMSEQILKTPDRISSFVNKWSKGVVARVFPLGACLDKLIGDCVMFLFGPPFYETDEQEIVKHMLQASQQIVNYTKSFLKLPENRDIQKHPDYEKFGVAVGVNFCHVVVGLIGPNEDFTAFSSGVNITARLQGQAKANEILVTESVKEIAEGIGKWNFSEKRSTMVKNVEKPLGYYQLITK